MTLSEAEVRRVAHLARLSISDEELPEMTTQLANVLGLVDQLGEVNTDGVEPLVHAIEITNVLQPDRSQPSLVRDEVLQNAPSSDSECFRVPAVLG
ncbi:MAG: Asp-tRNA(Asn)/Glu-tRNA(Gln) amidotransferase subunit GatC [Pirellula sp.]|jgi:aspartyl-tRNA(Asn)/glutamyl-tRNA(Gln) amidotransferase subunit C